MKYRAEIDGLRALAVIPVILFHAGFELFAGGFIGVDVFFVISGYLITSIILSEIDQGKFSILNFYERRARRILPALFFIMAVCIPFAWLWLVPSDLKNFGQSLIAVSTFVSNFLFWQESGYFDTAAELKPLLHTWSLAVEEQYYILFPLFLMLTWKLGIKLILILLSIVFLVSLSIAEWGSYNEPSASFFLLPTRGWELLVGVFSAFYLKYNSNIKPQFFNQLLSLLGLTMIIYSIIVFDETTPFPGFYALIPTIGTALLILYAVPNTIAHKLLSLKIFVGIGLISYSAYLWHQPLLAFARHRNIGELSDILLTILCISSLLLAWLSWNFVEKPFRDKSKIGRQKIFKLSLIGILVFSALGTILQFDSVRFNAPSSLESVKYTSLSDKINQIGEVCKSKDIKEENLYSFCEIGSIDSASSVLIFGDSHTQSIQYELNRKLLKKNIKGIWIKSINTKSNQCETTIFTLNKIFKENDDFLSCINSYKIALNDFSDAKYLILLNRWSMKYFFSESIIKTPHFENTFLNCVERDLNYRSYVPFDQNGWKPANEQTMKSAIDNFLTLSSSKIKTLLVYPYPEIGCDPYRYVVSYKQSKGEEIKSLSFPVKEYDKRNQFVIDQFDESVDKSNGSIIPVKLRPVFCESEKKEGCFIIKESKPLYLDDDHLSDYGAKLVVDEIFEAFAY